MGIVDFVGHRVTPLHPELVTFGIVANEIVFDCRCLVFRDVPIGKVGGVIREIDTTAVAVFVPLLPCTTASAGLGAGGTIGTTTCRTMVALFLCGTVICTYGMDLIVVPDNNGGHLLYQLLEPHVGC